MSIDAKKSSLRQRNHERMRQRILDAALSLFSAEGYEQTTMDAIAEQAEVGRATLFKYFPAKSALLLPLSQQILFAELRPQIEALLERQPTTAQALRLYFDLLGRRIDELSDMARALIKVIGMVEKKEASERVPDFAATLSVILEYGRARGEVRSDIPIGDLSGYIAVLYGKMVNEIVGSEQLENYPAVMHRLLSFVETGFAS